MCFATGRVPPEVARFILSYLPLPDLNSARSVSHPMKALCDDAIASEHLTLSKLDQIETVVKAFGENPHLRITLNGNFLKADELLRVVTAVASAELEELTLNNDRVMDLLLVVTAVASAELEELPLNNAHQITNKLQLTLNDAHQITNKLLQHIWQLPKLRRLHLNISERSGMVSTRGLLGITQLKGLEELTLLTSQFTNAVLGQIGQLTKLRCLNLNWSEGFTTDGLVSMLPHLVNLEKLHIATYKAEVETDAFFDELGRRPKLQRLGIYDSKRFTADSLVSMLEKLGNLKELTLIRRRSLLSKNQGPNATLNQLEPLQKLERLIKDDGNGFTDDHRAFIQEKLKTMQIFFEFN